MTGRAPRRDRAVSSLAGTGLMVVLALAMAGVMAAFALVGGGVAAGPEPDADIAFSHDGTDLTLTHDGGATFNQSHINVTGPTTGNVTAPDWVDGDSDTVKPGATYTVTGVTATDTVRVVWTGGERQEPATMATWTGPSASESG